MRKIVFTPCLAAEQPGRVAEVCLPLQDADLFFCQKLF